MAMPPPIFSQRSILTTELPGKLISASDILGLSQVSDTENTSYGLSFISNRRESIFRKILRVFSWEIFSPRTLGSGIEKLQLGPRLVEMSLDINIRIIEMEKFMAIRNPRVRQEGFGGGRVTGNIRMGIFAHRIRQQLGDIQSFMVEVGWRSGHFF